MNMIAWIDLETTGLKPNEGVILEVACILTDMGGNELARYHTIIGHDRAKVLPMMEDKVLSMHLETGLLQEVWARYQGPPEEYGDRRTLTEKAQNSLISFLVRHRDSARRPMLGGSSVHFDDGWLKHHMPEVEDELFYRQANVSIFQSCYPEMFAKMKELAEGERADGDWGPKHRAMSDIEWSVALYRASKKLMPVRRGLLDMPHDDKEIESPPGPDDDVEISEIF